MPLFAIYCVDKQDSRELRAATRPAHLGYVAGIGDRLLAAGPLLDGDRPAGSLLIVEFPDAGAAEAFAAGDPYNKAGLFESVRVTGWRKVLPEV